MAKQKSKDQKIKKKSLRGIVVSNKMQNTVVVKVSSRVAHPMYQKITTKIKKYKAHTEQELNVGDVVRIESTRPISKDKSWRVVAVLDDVSKMSVGKKKK